VSARPARRDPYRSSPGGGGDVRAHRRRRRHRAAAGLRPPDDVLLRAAARGHACRAARRQARDRASRRDAFHDPVSGTTRQGGERSIMNASRILVVEDEAIVATDITSTLRSLGCVSTASASSGAAAIQAAEVMQPDLVLMDIRLKDGDDGVKAAREIGDRFGIPVVYLTAHADEQTLRRAKATQPFGYGLKPFDERDLHVAIEMALHRHRTQANLQRLAIIAKLT